MENFEENRLVYEEIESLEDTLQELLDKSEKILGYKYNDIPNIVEKLFSLNSEIANVLANDILDVKDEIIKTEELYSDEYMTDDPFTTLYDEDEEIG